MNTAKDPRKVGRSCGLRVESRKEFHSGKLKHSNLLITSVKGFIDQGAYSQHFIFFVIYESTQ